MGGWAAGPEGGPAARLTRDVTTSRSRDVVTGCGHGMWSRDAVTGCGHGIRVTGCGHGMRSRDVATPYAPAGSQRPAAEGARADYRHVYRDSP